MKKKGPLTPEKHYTHASTNGIHFLDVVLILGRPPVAGFQHTREAVQHVVKCGPVDRVVVEARVHHLEVRGRGGGGHRWEALSPGVVVLAGPLTLGQDLGAHKRLLADVQLPASARKQVTLVSMARPEKWEGGGPGFQAPLIYFY